MDDMGMCCDIVIRGQASLADEGSPGCCCPLGTTPPCTGNHQGTVGRYLMDFHCWRVAIPSDCKVAIVTSLMLIVPSCADSLSIFGS
ncbi:hypothetical protein SLEP1_g31530 [Rubroshorea leprosula]|uniref:Uncharacterized protein n=1 Tax=Rubroshorea leprosula TaxID=152421 RepID=A0AAV5K9E2_9ROSI|nr:hypothetical protein SLEP1_g31530 [Rubroshorea leprosula]